MKSQPIDIVVPWVNSQDKSWIAKKNLKIST